jgi:Tol biopolymer transport system component
LTVAPDGTHLLVSDDDESLNLTRLPLTKDGSAVDGPEEPLSAGKLRDQYPSVSRDSRQILVNSNRVGQQDLWTVDVNTREWGRVEMPRQADGSPGGCWSTDNAHVVVMSSSTRGENAFWTVALDGSSFESLAPWAPGGVVVTTSAFACALSPDGRTLIFERILGGFNQLVAFDIPSKRERPLTTSQSNKYDAAWSPDGRWIAFSNDSGGTVNVWRIAPTGGREEQLTTGVDRIRHLFYSPDSRWLYVQPNHRNIYRMPADGGPRQAVTRFPDNASLFIEEPTITPDGRYLVYSRAHGGSSIWLLTLADQRTRSRNTAP